MTDDDQSLVLRSTTIGHAIVSDIARLPPRSGQRRKNQSTVWDYFTIEENMPDKAKCNHYGSILKCSQGTSSMIAHAKKCQKRQKVEEISSPSLAKFDQERSEIALVKMIIAMELPYRHVDHKAFHEFMSVVQPRFKPISRHKLARGVLMLWDIEKTRLKNFLSEHCQSVCLTTDSWTSCQNLSYMCITAYFIDNSWTLHKKNLSFRQVKGHTGEVMAKKVAQCLTNWGLTRVLSVTVDNASSNDRGIENLKMRLRSWNGLVLNGDHIHTHCCAHILNLIVKEGLKEIDDSILRIRAAVKYIKSSPSRQLKFRSCVENCNIEYKGGVALDFDTRWNSTYNMLKAALKLEKAFSEFEITETKYREELERGKGVPTLLDWQDAREVLNLLEVFEKTTLRISGSSCVTSNIYMVEVFAIGLRIKEICESTKSNLSIKEMAKRMKKKYDKYWGNHKNLNMLVLIAFVLDPRYKLKYPTWFIERLFDLSEAIEFKENLISCLKAFYHELKGGLGEDSQGDSQLTQHVQKNSESDYYFDQFLQSADAKSSTTKSELSKYFKEDIEVGHGSDFDILNWWKVNSSRFPILGSIAREVLAIPASTVPSESAFSTGGWVLDKYRSCLTHKSVEALICTQDWFKRSPTPLLSKEDIEEIEKYEQEMAPLQLQDDGTYSTYVALDED